MQLSRLSRTLGGGGKRGGGLHQAAALKDVAVDGTHLVAHPLQPLHGEALIVKQEVANQATDDL